MVIDVAVIASLPHLHDLAACGSIDMALTHLALHHPGYAATTPRGPPRAAPSSSTTAPMNWQTPSAPA